MERVNSFESCDSRRADAQASIKDILLAKLLDSLKHCQTEFGAKNELATAEDSRVGFLLSQLEACLIHGIKKYSFLKDVTELVAKFSPFEGGPGSTLWSLIKTVLSEQENRRIQGMTYITSDAGRVRCWLRMALNERSLKRYFDMLNNDNVLSDYYEEWAFMRDSEITAALTQITTGFETILFALSTNDPDLNFPFSNNEEASQSMLEAKKAPQPILNVNRERKDSTKSDCDKKELQKKRKKPLVNLVSFDKNRSFSEADGQMRVILTRQPSGKQSTEISESQILYLEKSESVNDKLDSVFRGETPSEDHDDLSVDCASFDSGGDDCYNCTSVESGDNVDRRESEETVRTNSDVGLQTAYPPSHDARDEEIVTNEHNSTNNACFCNRMDEIRTLENSIEILRSALQSLKQEHNDFVRMQMSRMNSIKLECSNMRMLPIRSSPCREPTTSSEQQHSGDETPGDNKIDENLSAIYEKRLIELTQMHGELLELNESLSKQNRRKTAINERLKKELIALRGPLPEDLMTESDDFGSSNKFEERPLVNIWIPSAFLTGKGADVHHVYQVYVRIRESEWNIYRRYKDFLSLHNTLSKRDPTIKKFKFPPKKNFGHKNKVFVDDRRIHLEAYLRMVLNYVVQNFPEFSSIPVGRNTLARLLPFFQ